MHKETITIKYPEEMLNKTKAILDLVNKSVSLMNYQSCIDMLSNQQALLIDEESNQLDKWINKNWNCRLSPYLLADDTIAVELILDPVAEQYKFELSQHIEKYIRFLQSYYHATYQQSNSLI